MKHFNKEIYTRNAIISEVHAARTKNRKRTDAVFQVEANVFLNVTNTHPLEKESAFWSNAGGARSNAISSTCVKRWRSVFFGRPFATTSFGPVSQEILQPAE